MKSIPLFHGIRLPIPRGSTFAHEVAPKYCSGSKISNHQYVSVDYAGQRNTKHYDILNTRHMAVGRDLEVNSKALGSQKQLPPTVQSDDILNTREATLCPRCASLRFEDLLTTPKARKQCHEILNLGELPDSLAESACPLCRLFCAVKTDLPDFGLPIGELRPYYTLVSILWGYRRPKDCTDEPLPDKAFLCVVRLPKERAERVAWRIPYATEVNGCIALLEDNDTQLQQQFHTVKRLAPAIRDFGFLREWVDKCESLHGSKCSLVAENLMWPRNLVLIACRERRLVRGITRVKYAALSYVWGTKGAANPLLTSSGCLPLHLPPTIEDAISIALQCGIEYVWIDRYCIDQNDATQKHDQIRQMDLIYRNAYLTMVDATGSDPEVGLSGISRARPTQLCARLGSHTLAATPSHIHSSSIRRPSPWATRGWTYQESFFSQRLLIFTEEQVHWECSTTTYLEVMPTVSRENEARMVGKKDVRLWDIWKYLTEYSKRYLSYDSDAISAIAGVLHHFEQQEVPLHTLVGVPVVPDVVMDQQGKVTAGNTSQSVSLVANLAWRNDEQPTRRSMFPSWSWAGWKGEFSLKRIPQYSATANGSKFADVKVEDSRGDLIDLDTLDFGKPSIEDLSRTCRFIHIDVHTLAIKTKRLSRDSSDWTYPDSRWKPAPTALGIFSGFFAIFEDSDYRLEVAICSMSCSYDGKSFHAHWTPKGSDEGLLGLVFANCAEPVFPKADSYPFILLVQDFGTHFERAGYMYFNPNSMRLVSKLDHGNFVSWETQKSSTIPWALCFGAAKRKSIRLG